jgi:hypothetical protein
VKLDIERTKISTLFGLFHSFAPHHSSNKSLQYLSNRYLVTSPKVRPSPDNVLSCSAKLLCFCIINGTSLHGGRYVYYSALGFYMLSNDITNVQTRYSLLQTSTTPMHVRAKSRFMRIPGYSEHHIKLPQTLGTTSPMRFTVKCDFLSVIHGVATLILSLYLP